MASGVLRKGEDEYPPTHHWNQKKLLCFAKHSQIMQLLLAETPNESSDSSPSKLKGSMGLILSKRFKFTK
ncbi:hypothetical protein D5086_025948 [Populus alba]|uniref:Uncharacterized protein n=1 Tax=Populus alba TaxID=43335 RepID=A0ACC4B117_POPAL